MILREWRGRARRSNAADYPEHFRNRVVAELRHIPGFLGAFLGQRQMPNDQVEFLVLTRWASMDAILAFAGPNPEKAVVEPGAVVALTDHDTTVRHYEVLEEVTVA